jgi:O-antigen ligase
MPRRSRRIRADESLPDFFSWVSMCALAAACLSVFDRGGNTDQAIGWIACCSFVALAASVAQSIQTRIPMGTTRMGYKAWIAALCLLCAFAMVGVLPISIETWASLPGRDRYQLVLKHLASPTVGSSSIPISMAPDAGLRSVVLLLSCTAIAICAASFSETLRFRLLIVLIAIALAQALLGVAQIAFRGASIFTLDYVGHVRASGSFVNKNHLATLFALLIPFAALRASQSLSDIQLRYDLRRLFSTLWIGITLVLVLACMATLSRSGIAAALAVLITAITVETLRAARRDSKRQRVFATGFAALVFLVIVLGNSESFFAAIGDPGASGSFAARIEMYRATVDGAVALFPLGSGIGSYAVAFPAFQPLDLGGFIEHAHNDVLQLLFEAGFMGIGALALLLVAAFAAFRDWRESSWNPRQSAYILGALGFALHANLDFPARIPSLAVIATILFSFACNFHGATADATIDSPKEPKSV